MSFDRKRTLWESGFVNPSLFGVRADNITPMTVTGTNTFIVHKPGTPEALIVDPGPADVLHLRAVLGACEARGAAVGGIFITHTHADHIAGTDLLLHLLEFGSDSVQPDAVPAALDGKRFLPKAFGKRAQAEFANPFVPVFAKDLGNCPEGPFAPLDAGPTLSVVALPGHSDDTVGLLLHDERCILTGDNIFRFWSSVVPYGDGNLADYLNSLHTLQQLVADDVVDQLVPAHGFPIDQPIKAIEGYRAHRLERLEEVRRVVDSGAGLDPVAVVRGVYGDIDDPMLLRACYSSTFAQLEYLAESRGVQFEPDLSLIAMTPEYKEKAFDAEISGR